jgi:hypothetical protein
MTSHAGASFLVVELPVVLICERNIYASLILSQPLTSISFGRINFYSRARVQTNDAKESIHGKHHFNNR